MSKNNLKLVIDAIRDKSRDFRDRNHFKVKYVAVSRYEKNYLVAENKKELKSNMSHYLSKAERQHYKVFKIELTEV